MSRKRQRPEVLVANGYHQFDKMLDSIVGQCRVMTLATLRREWHRIKDLINPGRLEYYLRNRAKRICPGCAEFLRTHLDRGVDIKFVDYSVA